MATTDIYSVSGSLYPTRHAIRFLGGDVDDGVQIDAAAAAMVANDDTMGTISAWIMCPSFAAAQTIFGAGDANAVEYMHFTVTTDGKLQFKFYDAGATAVDIVSANQVVFPHVWVHVAVVQNGSRPTLYVNGEPVAMTDTTMTTPGIWFSATDGIDGAHIGAADSIGGAAALTQEFKGYISDVKIWSGTTSAAALTADQIKQDYRGVVVGTAHNSYSMDGNVTDAGSGADNGTLVGDLIYVDANEFSSRFSFGCGTPVTADNVVICTDNGMAFALVIQAA